MKDKVRERWAILRIALREGRVAQGTSSVRNHPGFSLFAKERNPALGTAGKVQLLILIGYCDGNFNE